MLKDFIRDSRYNSIWRKLVRFMACIVVFCTTYALILPAITEERPATCGKEEHQHTELCYQTVQTEQLQCDSTASVFHSHGELCYREDETLRCTLPEVPVHEHSRDCYINSAALCGVDGLDAHQHEESCLGIGLICPLMEGDGHTHEDNCYQDAVLVCQLAEEAAHQHFEDCYNPVFQCATVSPVIHTHTDICFRDNGTQLCTLTQMESHEHTGSCYENTVAVCQWADTRIHQHTEACLTVQEEVTLFCQLEEHIHDDSCHSDSEADLETENHWLQTLKPVKFTGIWSRDLVAIAQTQVGYRESQNNYLVAEDGQQKGYTRYGQWFGSLHEDWNTLFTAFCLHYAEVPSEIIPARADAALWLKELRQSPVTSRFMDCEPAEGSLLFYSYPEKDKIHTAIVAQVEAVEGQAFLTIFEGDRDDEVSLHRIRTEDILLHGCCDLDQLQNFCREYYPEYMPQDETKPTETTVPEESIPEESVPEESVPDESVPEESIPGESVPDESIPDESIPEENIPDESVPEEPELPPMRVRTAETENYIVTVSYSPDLDLPENAQLQVSEYARDSEIFLQRCVEAGYELEWLLNIGFYVDGIEFMPQGPFQVQVTAKQGGSLGQDITHFKQEGAERLPGTGITPTGEEESLPSVSFSTDSFSDFGGGIATVAETGSGMYTFTTANPRQLLPGKRYAIYTISNNNLVFLTTRNYLDSTTVSRNGISANTSGDTWSINASQLQNASLDAMSWKVESGNSGYKLTPYTNSAALIFNNGGIWLQDGSTLSISATGNAAGAIISCNPGYGTFYLYNNNGNWIGSNSRTTVYFAEISEGGTSGGGNGGETPDPGTGNDGYPTAVATGKASITRLNFYNFLGSGSRGGGALADCVFEIVGDNGYTTTLVSTNNPAMSLPEGIPDGNYTITEISAPSGYIMDLNPVRSFRIVDGSFHSTENIGFFINHPTDQVPTFKTAQVENYSQRIYRVDMGARSNLKTYTMDPIDVRFVVDQSNSMLFPAGLVDTGKNITLRVNDSSNANRLENLNLDKSQMYYVMADPSGKATVYSIWHDGNNWLYQDASYYAKAYYNNTDGYESPNGELSIFPGNRSYDNQESEEERREQAEGGGVNYRSNGGGIAYDMTGSGLATYINNMGGSVNFDLYTASNGYNRLHYLEDAMAQVVSALADANRNNHVSITQFTKTTEHSECLIENSLGENEVQELLDHINGIHTSGGTRQDLALEHILNTREHPRTPGANTYVVLITDGSPDASDVQQVYRDITTHANTIKNQGTVLMTVGLGMGAATEGLNSLQSIASYKNDGSGGKYFYPLNDAAGLVSALHQLLFDSMYPNGTLNTYADITDEISDSFYPIAWTPTGTNTGHALVSSDSGKDWLVLEPGDWITLEGKLTSQGASDAAGQLTQNPETGTYRIQWKNISLSSSQWRGQFYVKAKEDFLGGNVIDTNKSATVSVYGDPSAQNSYNPEDFSTEIPLDTPTVNVRLLDMTENSRMTTVYLGDIIGADGTAPGIILKDLYQQILFQKLVADPENKSDLNYGSMLNKLDPDSSTADGLERDRFFLRYAMSNLASDRPLTEAEWNTLLSGGSLTIPYLYDDSSSHGAVGEFVIRITASGEGADFSEHTAQHSCQPGGVPETDDCGHPAEGYTLTVTYRAYGRGEDGRPAQNVYNGERGPGQAVGSGGTPQTGQGTLVSENNYEVHVISGVIRIYKELAGGKTSTEHETFTFTLHNDAHGEDHSRDIMQTITVPAGSSQGQAAILFTDLPRGSYTVTENWHNKFTLENLTLGVGTNCESRLDRVPAATAAHFTMGNDPNGDNVIGKSAETDVLTSYIREGYGVYGEALFINTPRGLPVEKIWDDGAEYHLHDAVYIVLYQDGAPVLDDDGNARILRLDAANNWKGTFIVPMSGNDDTLQSHHYSVREACAVSEEKLLNWKTARLENDGTTFLYYEKVAENGSQIGVSGKGYMPVYEQTEDGKWIVTNIRGTELPQTGGAGTNLYSIGGLLMILAALIYGYILKRKAKRGVGR